MALLDDEFYSLTPKTNQFSEWIKDISSRRGEVNEKKFSDPGFVGNEYSKLIDASKLRDHCKK